MIPLTLYSHIFSVFSSLSHSATTIFSSNKRFSVLRRLIRAKISRFFVFAMFLDGCEEEEMKAGENGDSGSSGCFINDWNLKLILKINQRFRNVAKILEEYTHIWTYTRDLDAEREKNLSRQQVNSFESKSSSKLCNFVRATHTRGSHSSLRIIFMNELHGQHILNGNKSS